MSQNNFSLDVSCSVEALSEALEGWGDDTGSIVVISHDKAFCDKLGFTHVITVENGSLSMEQREARASDWDTATATLQRKSLNETPTSQNGRTGEQDMDPATRKKLFNAPKRIRKIEELIDRKETQIALLNEEMLKYGSDVGQLVDLTEKKKKIEKEIAKLMEEWEELEKLLDQTQTS